MQGDWISEYIAYASESSEVPATFHRWSAMAGIGALLGRGYYFHHGHFTLYPNLYAMLIGSPGTRKSSAIKLMKKILLEAGYDTIAADKTTKEKFLLDLAGIEGDVQGGKAKLSPEQLLDQNIFGEDSAGPDREMFIMADEFNDFFGNGNIEFVSLLGTLWDFSGVYKNRIKNGTSVCINNPTVSILGGNTPTGFSLAFPTEILGQGFFSRILLIYGEPNGKRIAFPKPPSMEHTAQIIRSLKELPLKAAGEAILTDMAEKLLEKIYEQRSHVDDVRFESYANRRFTHLLKLLLIVSAARRSRYIEEQDVIHANTVLSYTEQLMPKALGEFGKARNSDVSHKVIQLAESSYTVLTFKDMWKHVSNDLEKMSDLAQILQNLVAADKLLRVPDGSGFLAVRKRVSSIDSSILNYDLLTEEERRLIV